MAGMFIPLWALLLVAFGVVVWILDGAAAKRRRREYAARNPHGYWREGNRAEGEAEWEWEDDHRAWQDGRLTAENGRATVRR
jgi:hypothetical protein